MQQQRLQEVQRAADAAAMLRQHQVVQRNGSCRMQRAKRQAMQHELM
jgi:hypothetical protein